MILAELDVCDVGKSSVGSRTARELFEMALIANLSPRTDMLRFGSCQSLQIE
jgi:hypothetical protein